LQVNSSIVIQFLNLVFQTDSLVLLLPLIGSSNIRSGRMIYLFSLFLKLLWVIACQVRQDKLLDCLTPFPLLQHCLFAGHHWDFGTHSGGNCVSRISYGIPDYVVNMHGLYVLLSFQKKSSSEVGHFKWLDLTFIVKLWIICSDTGSLLHMLCLSLLQCLPLLILHQENFHSFLCLVIVTSIIGIKPQKNVQYLNLSILT
jgi:hypothetical protein